MNQRQYGPTLGARRRKCEQGFRKYYCRRTTALFS
jgi:hypothetical protein